MVLHVAAATAEFQVQKSVILLRDSGNDVSGSNGSQLHLFRFPLPATGCARFSKVTLT